MESEVKAHGKGSETVWTCGVQLALRPRSAHLTSGTITPEQAQNGEMPATEEAHAIRYPTIKWSVSQAQKFDAKSLVAAHVLGVLEKSKHRYPLLFSPASAPAAAPPKLRATATEWAPPGGKTMIPYPTPPRPPLPFPVTAAASSPAASPPAADAQRAITPPVKSLHGFSSSPALGTRSVSESAIGLGIGLQLEIDHHHHQGWVHSERRDLSAPPHDRVGWGEGEAPLLHRGSGGSRSLDSMLEEERMMARLRHMHVSAEFGSSGAAKKGTAIDEDAAIRTEDKQIEHV